MQGGTTIAYGAPQPPRTAAPANYGAPPPAPMAIPVNYGAQQMSFGFGPTRSPTVVPYPAAPARVTVFMPAPPSIPNCPSGLEYLTMVDQLLVHQLMEMLEIMTGFETNNKYEVKNTLGQLVYFAAEENDACTRECCGALRPFKLTIVDNSGKTVLELRRPCRCQGCCYPCCLQRLEVYSAGDQLIGIVEQNWTAWSQSFTVYNAEMEPVLNIIGPCLYCRCTLDVKFSILSLEGTEIGNIQKQWSGYVREMYTDTDCFSVSFPINLEVKTKATLLACAFLLDFMFFEENHN